MEENYVNTGDNNKKEKKPIALVIIIVLAIISWLIGVGAIIGITAHIMGYSDFEKGILKNAIEQVAQAEEESDKAEKVPEIQKTETLSNVEYYGVIDVSDVVKEVMPSMVSVINKYTETYQSFWGQGYSQEAASSGSGIIIGENDTELLIATNYHVIAGSNSIEITFIDETVATAYIKGTNPEMDLAVVSVILEDLSQETKNNIAVANLGNSEQLELGDAVIAIGNALGYGQSVTTGVVSALDREVANEDGTTGKFIQTDAAINPGNSGGALLNMNGEVIGINSSKIGGSTIEGIGFAIPISAAQPIIDDLSSQTTKIKIDENNRGYLGISVYDNSESLSMYGMPSGLIVNEVEQGGAAELAGMQKYDIIVKLDTFDITNYSDLKDALQYYKAGTTVKVEVMRLNNGEYTSIILDITLGKKPIV